ncbi:hypothetical protein N7454_000529 [Penicillium verhagenii]|nr:hypothetical protein N7454_000529 [Penicillium verhagenii]
MSDPDVDPPRGMPESIANDTTSSHNSVDQQEEWTAKTAERQYYHRDGVFIKRSLRPSEYMTTIKGNLHIPRLGKERLQNEAESLRFIRRVSDVPVPTVYGSFEVDDSYFLLTEYIDGVGMSQLPDDQKELVWPEISQHLKTLYEIKSTRIGGPSGIMVPPYRVMDCTEIDSWSLKLAETPDYVFCHNDLSQYNIIVDPKTLKINAIIDWEYAGFFPEYFEAPFYKRRGPSVALDGEPDDVPQLLQFLNSRSRLVD